MKKSNLSIIYLITLCTIVTVALSVGATMVIDRLLGAEIAKQAPEGGGSAFVAFMVGYMFYFVLIVPVSIAILNRVLFYVSRKLFKSLKPIRNGVHLFIGSFIPLVLFLALGFYRVIEYGLLYDELDLNMLPSFFTMGFLLFLMFLFWNGVIVLIIKLVRLLLRSAR